jgi:hypothetical protein
MSRIKLEPGHWFGIAVFAVVVIFVLVPWFTRARRPPETVQQGIEREEAERRMRSGLPPAQAPEVEITDPGLLLKDAERRLQN